MTHFSMYSQLNKDVNLSDDLTDDILIDMIRSRPWIYDLSHKNYGDTLMTRNAWKDIAEVMDVEVSKCEKRWSQLRDKYYKEKMAKEKETKSGSGKTNRQPWQFYEQMRPLMEKRAGIRCTTSNVPSISKTTCVDPKGVPQAHNYYKSKNKTLKSNDDGLQAAIQDIQSTINKMTQQGSERNLVRDADQLFGELVIAELTNFEDNAAKTKYKRIIKYLSELD